MCTTTTDPKETLFALLHPVFRECVDPENGRYDLSTPFVNGEFVYASNGHIIVRSLATPEVSKAFLDLPVDPKSKRLKKPDDVYLPADYLPDPLPLPAVAMLPVCKKCKGKGEFSERRCDHCWGRGQVTCEYDHEHDCPECDGKGWTPAGKCEVCYGYGCGVARESIAVGNHQIAQRFLLLLAKHSASLFAPVMTDGKQPLKFTVGPDVEGRLMPMVR